MKTRFTIAACLASMTVLSCGGGSGSSSGSDSSKQWVVLSTTGKLAQSRDMHTATLLQNGKVLIIGGETQGSTLPNGLASAELYDPATQTFSPAGNLVKRRLGHASVLLPNGKVIVVGGWDVVDGNGATGLQAVEEWDPASKTFHVIGTLNHEHGGGQAFLRQDGKIQVVGGFDVNLQLSSDSLLTEVFDPATGTSVDDFPLSELEMRATLVPIDPSHFILLGGENGIGGWGQLDSAYLYATDGALPNPSAGGRMPYAFAGNTAVNHPSGKVVAGGGYNQSAGMSDTICILDYLHLGSGIQSVKMREQRMGHQTMIFPDGSVGFVGGETFTGYEPTTYLADIEVLDMTNLTTHLLSTHLHTPRTRHTLTMLNDGSFLIVGGYNYEPTTAYNWTSLKSCELIAYQ